MIELIIQQNRTTLRICMDPGESIMVLKREILVRCQRPLSQMHLEYKEQILFDDQTIEECGLTHGDIITLTYW